ncbi:MAG TPA: adenylate/guanylate cyclase domain-containing protein [Vitreimonas sp.]|jgi:adenylate cyclase|nr:adenylate/guanylate cyclase domain-containing protein [Vitreimonas sp.]
MSSPVQRKLTTILAADADGYSRVMETDEVGALQSLRAARDVFAKFIERHHGRIANTAGDGLIAEFPSVVEAVQCAIEVQQELSANARQNDLRFRIGVHLGDVIVDGDDLLGEGVNLAARLQSMADPGGILISRQVYDQVQKKLSVGFSYLGEKRPKNFAESVAVYSVATPDIAAPAPQPEAKPEKPAKTDRKSKPPVDLRRRSIHEAILLGAIWALLFAADVADGGAFWSQWALLLMAFVLGMRAAPLFARGWFGKTYVRLAMIAVALALINLFNWNGTVWFIWPTGILLIIILFGRLRAGPG